MSQVFANGVDSPDWVGGANQGGGVLVKDIGAILTGGQVKTYGPFYVGNIPFIRVLADAVPGGAVTSAWEINWYPSQTAVTPTTLGPNWSWTGNGGFLQVIPTFGPWFTLEVLYSNGSALSYDVVVTACGVGVSDQASPGAIMLQTGIQTVAAGASLNFVPTQWVPGAGTLMWLGDSNTRINVMLGSPAASLGSLYQCFTPPPPPFSNSQPFTFPQSPWYVNFLNSDTVSRVMSCSALSGS